MAFCGQRVKNVVGQSRGLFCPTGGGSEPAWPRGL